MRTKSSAELFEVFIVEFCVVSNNYKRKYNIPQYAVCNALVFNFEQPINLKSYLLINNMKYHSEFIKTKLILLFIKVAFN